MAALSRPRPKKLSAIKATALWFERLFALIALLNLVLVLFDISYIPFRDLYLRFFPEFTTWYGATFKGIEPERTTVQYLETIHELQKQVSQTGLQSTQAQTLLADLREQSEVLVNENPFAGANKTGTLERIKNAMRDHMGFDSAKDSFKLFWSKEFLTQAGWAEEIKFFEKNVIPLLQTNYFRPIGTNNLPVDYFWRIDIFFVLFFALELLARTFYISRRYKNYTWLDALLLRWYDLFLLLPFWRWLRIIPVIIRLNQSHLVNLVPLRNRINRIFITNFAVELTEVVILRVIDQIQNLIRNGQVSQWLLEPNLGRQYIDINGVNEVQAITERLTSIALKQVLPQVKPEIDALVHHNVVKAFNQAPGYQVLRALPGIGSLPEQVAQQVVSQVSQNLYQVISGLSTQDEVGDALRQTLFSKLGMTMRQEVRATQSVDELEQWAIALLEEVKINYVKQLSVEDIDQLMEENYRLYNLTQTRSR